MSFQSYQQCCVQWDYLHSCLLTTSMCTGLWWSTLCFLTCLIAFISIWVTKKTDASGSKSHAEPSESQQPPQPPLPPRRCRRRPASATPSVLLPRESRSWPAPARASLFKAAGDEGIQSQTAADNAAEKSLFKLTLWTTIILIINFGKKHHSISESCVLLQITKSKGQLYFQPLNTFHSSVIP